MATIDPNVYALSVQLNLDSTAADSTLDKFTTKVKDVESDVAASATRALTVIQDIAGRAVSSLSETITGMTSVAAQTKLVGEHHEHIDTQLAAQRVNLSELMQSWDDVVEAAVKLDKYQMKEIDNFEEINDSVKELHKNLGDKNKYHDDENEKLEKEKVTWGQIQRSVMGVINFLKDVDKGTENFVTANYRVYGSQQQLLNSSRMLTTSLGITGEKAIEVVKNLADVATPVEDMHKLALVVGDATRVMGISAAQAAEYTKKLRITGMDANAIERQFMKTTDAMRKYGLNTQDVARMMSKSSEQMIRMNQLLGASSAESLAKLELHTMGLAKQFGYSTEAVAGFYQKMSDPEALLSLGALTGVAINNTKDLNVALNRAGGQLADMQAEIERVSKAGGDTAALTMQMNGMAEAMGMNAEMAQFAAKRYNYLQKELARTGESMDDLDAVTRALKRHAMDPLAEANDTLIGQLNVLTGYFAWIGVILQFFVDCVKDAVWMLNMLLLVISSVIGAIINILLFVPMVIVEIVKFGLKLVGLLQPLIDIATAIYNFISPAIWLVTKLFRGLIGVLIIGLAVLVAFSGGIGTLIGAMSAWVASSMSLSAAFAAAGTALSTMMTAFAANLTWFAGVVGTTLSTLGSAVAPVIVPLMGLGVALMLVAGAAYIFAMAMNVLAQGGVTAIAAGVALMVGIYLIITALTSLSAATSLLTPALPFVYAFVAAVLALGFAAFLVGAGIGLAAEGIARVVESIDFELITGMQLFALALAMIGGAALIAAIGFGLIAIAVSAAAYIVPILGAMGGGMLMVAIASLLAGAAIALIAMNIDYLAKVVTRRRSPPLYMQLYMLAGALIALNIAALISVGGLVLLGLVASKAAIPLLMVAAAGLLLAAAFAIIMNYVSPDKIKEFVDALKYVADVLFPIMSKLLTIGFGLVVAGVALLVAGIMIAIAGWALYAGSIGLVFASDKLKYVAEVLGPAAVVIRQASVDLRMAGLNLVLAAPILAFGSVLLIVASLVIGVAAIALFVAGALLTIGVLPLTLGAYLLSGAAALLYGASLILYDGVNILLMAVNLLMEVPLLEAAIPFAIGSFILLVGSMMLVASAALILLGAVGISAGSVALIGASALLTVAGIALVASSIVFRTGLSFLQPGALAVMQYGLMIFIGGTSMLMGVMALNSAIALLYYSAATLALVSPLLLAAVGVFAPAAMGLYVASVFFLPASAYFAVASMMFSFGAALFGPSAMLFAEGAVALAVGIIALAIASPLLLGTGFMLAFGLMLVSAAIFKFIPMIPFVFLMSFAIERLASAFTKLATATTDLLNFSALNIDDMFGGISSQLDTYADRVISAATRINAAINEKAIPAMRAAESAGLKEAIKSEAITTVKVMKEDETNAAFKEDTESVQSKTLDVMNEMRDILSGMTATTGENPVTMILALLQAYLPKIAKRDGGLTSELNAWAK